MRTGAFLFLGAALALAGLASCGDDNQAKCDELAELCHPVMTTLAQDCHETAEDPGDTQVCADRYDECLAACSSSGTTSSSSTGTGG